MFDQPDKTESLYHSILSVLRKIRNGTNYANNETSSLLNQHGSFEGIYNYFFQNEKIEDRLKNNSYFRNIAEQINTTDFRLFKINQPEYPECLKEIENPAPALYLKGRIELLQSKTIAVVGTRELEDLIDIEEGKKLVQRLIDKNYTIVSGLARGCDTLAHRFALENKGNTIAVLGVPINRYYPQENKELQDSIAKEHLLVSQYPIGVKTFPSYFAYRNKTTAGISTEGIVVIRAGDTSGTQHAIRYCLEQGKKLYVLRNNLNKGYKWTEKLKGKYLVP